MLESELGNCSAGETVPQGLQDRLMRLRVKAQTASPVSRRGPALAIAGGTILAVLLGLAARQALLGRDVADGNESAASELTDSGTQPGAVAAVGRPVVAPPETNATAAVPVVEETILEGFLFRRDGGVFVRDVSSWDHLPRQTMWDQRAEQLRSWSESLTIAGGVKGFPAPAAADFGPFLLHGGEPAQAPQARVKLKVRGPAAPEPEQNYDRMRMQAPKFAPQPVELVEVLESEVLGTAWLSAWRDMQNAAAEVDKAWQLPPGAEKRQALLEAATRLGTAWEIARGSRRGDGEAVWRIQRESETASAVVGRLRTVGLEGLMPAWPTPDDLHATLMDAGSPRDLRDGVIQRWGTEALGLEAWCYRSSGPGATSWSQLKLSDAAAMEEGEFRKLRKELEGIPENRPKLPDGPAMAERRREEHARVAAFGLEVEALSTLDRERHLVECGALVLSVLPGSSAERLGLVTGDILWKTVAEFEGKTGKHVCDVPIWGESGLATSLRDSGEFGGHVSALKVLRGGETLEIPTGK